MTYLEATKSCASRGGHLAIWTQSQAESVHQTLLKHAEEAGYSGSMWIGATYDQNRSKFENKINKFLRTLL